MENIFSLLKSCLLLVLPVDCFFFFCPLAHGQCKENSMSNNGSLNQSTPLSPPNPSTGLVILVPRAFVPLDQRMKALGTRMSITQSITGTRTGNETPSYPEINSVIIKHMKLAKGNLLSCRLQSMNKI